ncbi:hypothetical protein JHK86_034972 [Glycine max]|nr:hypothetical protein JHK86_034972 [Glycine max]
MESILNGCSCCGTQEYSKALEEEEVTLRFGVMRYSMAGTIRKEILKVVLRETNEKEEKKKEAEAPSKLDTSNSTGGFVAVSTDIMKYTSVYPDNPELNVILADEPAPWKNLLYYFEIYVKDADFKGKIAIGFTLALFLMNIEPWWEDLIAGHESSHGVLYSGDEDTGSTFLSGDVIGAGINYSTNEFFFCKNGELVHSVPNNLSNRGLYPTIAVLSQHEEMHVNFGQKPFAFNLKDFEARERRKQQQKIEEISLSPQVTYSLIRSYLLHSGYEDTFNSFDVVPSSPITDEQTNTLNHRSTLRQLIMNGNVDGAFAKVHEWYPQIVEDCIALRAYEMPLEVLANAVNAFVLSTDPHMEEAKDCLHSPLERLLKQLTACKRYEGEDFLVEKEFSKRD